MLTKIFTSILTISIIIFLFLLLLARYYQSYGIYFPTSEIQTTPKEYGLEYLDIKFKTQDNIELHGWYIPASENKATILFCHGNAGNISHRIEIIKLFNNIGLNVFIFDYRGYGKSQGRPSEKGLYKDAKAAYKYLTKELNTNKDKIIIYGNSIGGNVAIDLASKVEAGALISNSAFTSAVDMGKRIYFFLPVKLLQWLISIEYDAKRKIENINIPKLIIHSKDDEIIPYEQGKTLYKTAPEPKDFFKMRGGHNEAFWLQKDEYSNRIENFVKKYIAY